MAAKEISVKRYVVRLSGDERGQLEALNSPQRDTRRKSWRAIGN
jgi:hypothetical protein